MPKKATLNKNKAKKCIKVKIEGKNACSTRHLYKKFHFMFLN